MSKGMMALAGIAGLGTLVILHGFLRVNLVFSTISGIIVGTIVILSELHDIS